MSHFFRLFGSPLILKPRATCLRPNYFFSSHMFLFFTCDLGLLGQGIARSIRIPNSQTSVVNSNRHFPGAISHKPSQAQIFLKVPDINPIAVSATSSVSISGMFLTLITLHQFCPFPLCNSPQFCKCCSGPYHDFEPDKPFDNEDGQRYMKKTVNFML